jgi:hypothetical protein
MQKINHYWGSISRIGLREGEDVLGFREVIFLNRMLVILPIILILYVPLEIYFNGTKMLLIVGIMTVLFLLPLLLHHYRLFSIAHYYLILIGLCVISFAGVLAGKGIGNHVTLIPVTLLAVILFKRRMERVVALLVTICFFFTQHYLFNVVPPQMDLSDESRYAFSSIFFLMALILSFLIGYYFVSINKEYEDIVHSQKEAIALKNREITDSITYAKRIQNAILPPDTLLKEFLPQSFVIYRPKDIVAGDFYWLDKSGDTVLFAAADSTGHGVPGAMVSVICKYALSRSVREFHLVEPAHILDKAREIIIEEFEKSEEQINDGMDISLCALSIKTMTLKWAGANNPLIVIKPGQIIEIKADKQPVGKFSGKNPFTNHIVQLEKGNIIYVFTDGYADQFGGENGKKLKYKIFKELLIKYSHYPLEEQKKLLVEALISWQGNLEQQ